MSHRSSLFLVLRISNRQGSLVQMSITAFVRKEFRHEDAVEGVSKLAEIYKLSELKKVDILRSFNTESFYPYVYWSLVGIDALPEAVQKLMVQLFACYKL
jgi:hypothetical protein